MQRGPVYDNALRLLTTVDLKAICRWLGLEEVDDGIRVSESLPGGPQYADLVVQVTPDHLAHVEFTIRPEQEFTTRMVEYRARLMRCNPGCIVTQYVVVLARGHVPTEIRNGPDFMMRLHVTYLRDRDPAEFLSAPALAPLAVLAKARGREGHAVALRDALDVLTQEENRDRRENLVGIAMVLAAVHLDAATIEHIGKEAGMPITLEGTIGGRSLEARGEARGEARAQRGFLTHLLQRSFGKDPRIPQIADCLASWPQDKAVDAILEAGSLEELTTLAALPGA